MKTTGRQLSDPNVARLIKRAINATGESQAAFAQRMGTSLPTLSALLNGHRRITDETLCRVVDALHDQPVARRALLDMIERGGNGQN